MNLRNLRRLAAVFILVAIVVVLKLTVFRQDPVPVTVFSAAKGRVEETVTNSKAGTVKARRRASLSTEIGGRVAELPIRKGQSVRRGDLLLRLYDADSRAELKLQQRSLEAARAAATEAGAEAEQARRDLDRNRRLAEERIVSVAVLDQFQSRRDSAASSCEAARARVLQAESAVDLSRATLAKSVLTAPFDGIVAELTTELGEWITPSPPGLPIPPVVELIDPGALYVSAPLDEVDVGKVRVGLPVRITMDAFPSRSFPARLTRVAPYVQDREEQNRTFEIEAEFEDQAFSRTLVPGSSSDVEVILDARDDVLRIPSYALIEGSRVLVVRDDRLVSVPVTAGLRNWEFTEIAQGLSAGDRVAVSLDRAEVEEGAEVRVAGETRR